MSLRKSLALSALVAALLLVSAPAWALTQIAPTDRAMLARSQAVVVANALSSYTRLNAEGTIETVTLLAVEDVVKGAVLERTIEVVEPGGRFGDSVRIIPGVPEFQPGERVLLMLRSRRAGEWVVTEVQLGKFTFREDESGRAVLMRDMEPVTWRDTGVIGPAEHRARAAEPFVTYLRDAAKGDDSYFVEPQPLRPRAIAASAPRKAEPLISPYTAASYTLAFNSQTEPGYRWPSFPRTYSVATGPWVAAGGAESVATNAVNTALGAWNGASGAQIGLSLGASSSNTIQFEQDLSGIIGAGPFNCAPNGGGTLGIGGFDTSGGSADVGGESFMAITGADVRMNKGLAGCTLLGSNFDSGVTHEVGHSLGFRHADQGRFYNSSCSSGSMECDNRAIMTATVTAGLAGGLADWDTHAAAAVYPGVIICNAPAISSAGANPSSISVGQSTTLSVSATGSQLSYTWYRGAPGDTSSPVGSSASVTVNPSTNTTYWVKVSSGCGAAAASSMGVTVTVSCTPPSITGQPQSTSITAGQNASLSVSASGSSPTYQWYSGVRGNTSQLVGTSAVLNVSPTTTTSYWVRVSACGSSVDSDAATVSVAACDGPTILAQPQSTQIVTGNSTQLSVTAAGTSISYQWYSVSSGFTQPIGGNSSTVTVSPSTTTSYYVRVSGCGTSVNSDMVTVIVVAACTQPAVSGVSANPTSINEGSSSAISVTATGTSLAYQWYRGQPIDTSNAVTGGTASSVSVSPATTTTYWVRVTNGCGTANSGPVTVNVIPKCSTPSIAQPANQTIASGMATTITVAVTTTTDKPFRYTWYKGPKNDTSKPVGTDSATLRTDTISGTAQYWVKVTNNCGTSVSSDTIGVSTVVARRRPSRR